MKFEVADGLNMCTILVLLQEGHPEEKGGGIKTIMGAELPSAHLKGTAPVWSTPLPLALFGDWKVARLIHDPWARR